jgi:hypothetical protein
LCAILSTERRLLFLYLKAHPKRPPAQGSGWSAFARETQFAFSPDESIWDKGRGRL